jgi:hypothetical protein
MTKDEEMVLRALAAGQCTIQKVIDTVGPVSLWSKAGLEEETQKDLVRLLRIMGTFDLATGHASTMSEALDSLESELRDVLGHYRSRDKGEV